MKLIKSIMSAFAIVLATTACAGNGGENKKSNEPTKEDNKMEETKKLPQMMTVRQIAKTGLLPENAIRVMLKNGQIKAVYSGRKALINFDNLCEYLKMLTVVG